jgi:hypothetical protein
MGIGIPEILLIMVFSGIGLVPIALVIWSAVVLHRVRTGQEALQAKLENIERLLTLPRV